jgi:hypothetical protein
MDLHPLEPPFCHLARCVACLALLVVTTASLAFAAIHVPLMRNVFNPHSTVGAIMLLGLFVLSILNFIALIYFVPRAAIALFRRPGTRTLPHLTVVAAGVIALTLVGTWLIWFYRR